MERNTSLADRVREIIAVTQTVVEEKKMFGGICFMVNDKMCLGVREERLMVRFDPTRTDELMEKEGCRPMDFTGRIMKGYAFVDVAVLNTKKKLEFWVNLAVDYNQFAKPSKKKKNK